jgi:NADH-quinone oxidoreductase subunit N
MGGIPLLTGFVGKVGVWQAAIDADYLWLVIVGVLSTVAGLFFYLRVIVLMYMQPAEDSTSILPAAGERLAAGVAAAVTVVVGVVPWPLLDWVRDALPF